MAQPLRSDALLDDLPRAPASDVKKHGWRGVMRVVAERGKVLVTNHDQAQAVILSTGEYQALVEAARRSATEPLEALRRRFDERLAGLAAPDAGTRLRAVFDHPARLAGRVKAGAGH